MPCERKKNTDPRAALHEILQVYRPGLRGQRCLQIDQQAADFSKYLENEQTDAGYQQAKKKQDTLDMFK